MSESAGQASGLEAPDVVLLIGDPVALSRGKGLLQGRVPTQAL